MFQALLQIIHQPLIMITVHRVLKLKVQRLRVAAYMVREMEAMTVSARSRQTDMHDYFLPFVLLLMIHQLQVARRIKVLLSTYVCTELDIVDLPDLVD